MQIHSLYTDGACSGNPGPGGWGVVVCFSDGNCHELGGRSPDTTNNRMEMQAAIEALQFLANSGQTQPVTIYTDSEYVKNGITKWIKNWKKRGWQKSTGEPVLNQDLWELLDQLNSRQILWEYVKGHSGDIHNERCDTIARAFSHNQKLNLQQYHDFTLLESWFDQSTNAVDSHHPKVANNTQSMRTKEINSLESILTQRRLYQDAQLQDAQLQDAQLELPIVKNVIQNTIANAQLELQSENIVSNSPNSHSMIDSIPDSSESLSREERINHLRNLIETLRVADEIATKGYFITSSELADLMDINASAVTSRGEHWVWRNWVVSRVRREGNQILWHLERVESVEPIE